MHKAWILALVVSVLGCEVLACWLDIYGPGFSHFEPAYRIFHLLQMAVLITLAWASYRTLTPQTLWKQVSTLVFTGLCFSFAGDIINSYLIDLSFIIQPQALLSAIPFAIAHFLYIGSFWKIGRAGNSPVPNNQIWITLIIWPPLAIGLWTILVDSTAGPVLKWLSFAYAHMVVLMALASTWPLRAWGKAAWIATAGGLIFLLSDSFFGAWLTEAQNRPLWVSQTIWTTYFLAQICILHVPLIPRHCEQSEAIS